MLSTDKNEASTTSVLQSFHVKLYKSSKIISVIGGLVINIKQFCTVCLFLKMRVRESSKKTHAYL